MDALWLEDGLARNTLDSYRRDLRQFGRWLQGGHARTLLEGQHADVLAYLAYRFEHKGKRARPPACCRASSASTSSRCARACFSATPP